MLLGAEVFSPLLLGELLGVSAFFWHAVKHIAKTSSNANTEINFFIENLLSFIVIYILLLLYKIINIRIVNSYTYLDDCTLIMKCLYEKLTLYYFALFRFNIILPHLSLTERSSILLALYALLNSLSPYLSSPTMGCLYARGALLSGGFCLL